MCPVKLSGAQDWMWKWENQFQFHKMLTGFRIDWSWSDNDINETGEKLLTRVFSSFAAIFQLLYYWYWFAGYLGMLYQLQSLCKFEVGEMILAIPWSIKSWWGINSQLFPRDYSDRSLAWIPALDRNTPVAEIISQNRPRPLLPAFPLIQSSSFRMCL